jgi:hypothetical protein
MENLGYPKSLLVVEKNLKDIAASSVEGGVIPDRRVDIVCFSAKGLHPLLVVECKACRFHADVLYQVIGYNKYIQASFIAIVNPYMALTGFYDLSKKQYRFIQTLPSYATLIEAVYG